MKRSLAALLALATFLAPLSAGAAKAPAKAESAHERIFYYRDGDRAFASLKKNYGSIDILAPQAHTIDGAGNLQGELPERVAKFAKRKKLDLMPLVTNGSFSKEVSLLFLSDADAQDRAIDAMVAEAKDEGYVGWQIDFEQIDASLEDAFSAFVARAADEFHDEGLVLSVAVVAKVSDDPQDYPGQLWQNLIGVFDYRALGKSVDFLSVMSYDEPNKTGPVSPYPWLTRVMDYTLSKVPAEKISMGVPLYYWEREVGGDTRIMEIGGAAGVEQAKKMKGAKKGYDDDMKTSFVKYKLGKEGRVVWYETQKSMLAKLALADAEGLRGVSAWALGLELPETHRAFKTWK